MKFTRDLNHNVLSPVVLYVFTSALHLWCRCRNSCNHKDWNKNNPEYRHHLCHVFAAICKVANKRVPENVFQSLNSACEVWISHNSVISGITENSKIENRVSLLELDSRPIWCPSDSSIYGLARLVKQHVSIIEYLASLEWSQVMMLLPDDPITPNHIKSRDTNKDKNSIEQECGGYQKQNPKSSDNIQQLCPAKSISLLEFILNIMSSTLDHESTLQVTPTNGNSQNHAKFFNRDKAEQKMHLKAICNILRILARINWLLVSHEAQYGKAVPWTTTLSNIVNRLHEILSSTSPNLTSKFSELADAGVIKLPNTEKIHKFSQESVTHINFDINCMNKAEERFCGAYWPALPIYLRWEMQSTNCSRLTRIR